MLSFSFQILTIVSLLFGSTLALPYKSPAIKSARSADTCADPSLAQTFYEAFTSSGIVHVLNNRWVFENSSTVNKANVWVAIHPEFRGWPTQQDFTVPLFVLSTADSTQILYRIGADAQTPPVVSGFIAGRVIAWVYDTPVCGSVPLLSAVLAAATDRYYTTNEFEHDNFVSAGGWTDTGVVAYVLPLYDS